MERELPEVNIEGTIFLVDVIKEELREKKNEKNVMGINGMRNAGSGNGYAFNYDTTTKNFPGDERIFELGFSTDFREVVIPDLIDIDPLGVAEKYNRSVEEILGKTDYELRIEPGSLLDLRWNRGILPTLAIARHIFYVDLQMGRLRPKDDFRSKGICFSEIKEYYDRDRRAYVIPYNPATREFQEDDVLALTEIPTDTIIVAIPHQYNLDQVGWYKMQGNSYAVESLEQMHYEARTLPWEETNIFEHIHRNVAEQLVPKDEFRAMYATPPDRLFRIPTDIKRKLPAYNIQGTDFTVDVNQLVLKQKGNPDNIIAVSDMDENADRGYKFWYSMEHKCLTSYAEPGAKLLTIPDFVELDPIGMALKHNIPENRIHMYDDFKLMVDQDVFYKIANKGVTPKVDIAGQAFHIDVQNGRLYTKDNSVSRGINFSDLQHYYSYREQAYIFPYKPIQKLFRKLALLQKKFLKISSLLKFRTSASWIRSVVTKCWA